MTTTKINIVGIGDDGLDGLTTSARQLVQQAELLVGPKPALAVAAASKAEKLEIGSDLDGVVERSNQAQQNGRARLPTSRTNRSLGSAEASPSQRFSI